MRKEDRRKTRDFKYALERVQRSKKTPEFVTGEARQAALASNPELQRRLLEEELKLAEFQRKRQQSIMIRLAEEEARRADKHWRKQSTTIGDVAALPRRSVESILMIAGGAGAGSVLGQYLGKSAVEQVKEAQSQLGGAITLSDVRMHMYVEPHTVREAVVAKMKKDERYWQAVSGQKKIKRYRPDVIGLPGWIADEVKAVRGIIRQGGSLDDSADDVAAMGRPRDFDPASDVQEIVNPLKEGKKKLLDLGGDVEDSTEGILKKKNQVLNIVEDATNLELNDDDVLRVNEKGKLVFKPGKRSDRLTPEQSERVSKLRSYFAAREKVAAAEVATERAVSQQGRDDFLYSTRKQIREDATKKAIKINKPLRDFEKGAHKLSGRVKNRTTVPLANLVRTSFRGEPGKVRNIARLKLGGGVVGVAAAVVGGSMLINKIRKDRIDAEIMRVSGIDPSERVKKSWFTRRRKYGPSGEGF